MGIIAGWGSESHCTTFSSHVHILDGENMHLSHILYYTLSLSFYVTEPCSSSPCQNGATCTVNGYSYVCLCVNGYIGSFCEIGKYISVQGCFMVKISKMRS